MLVENQKVEVRWNNFSKKHYVDKGYVYTHDNDIFLVNSEDVKHTSCIKIKVKCDYCGTEKYICARDYYKNTKDGLIKYACKKCGRRKANDYRDKSKYFDLFLIKCNEHNCIPISTIDDYINAHSKLQFVCPKHGLQEITYISIYSGCWCRLCGFESLLGKHSMCIDELVKRVEQKNGNKLLNPEEYINCKTANLRILCGSCGNEFITSLESINNSDGACLKCSHKKTGKASILSSEEVKCRIESSNENILLNPEDYVGNNILNLKIKCKKCDNIYTTSLVNFENGKGLCDNCLKEMQRENKRLSYEEVINRIESKNNNKLLNPYEYKGNTSKLIIECGSCGKTFTQSLASYKQNIDGKCPDCSEKSYGEYLIALCLDKYKISYSRQEHFNGDCRDINPLPFDFYLPEYNICIEFDGKQHYEPKFGEEAFYKTLLHDSMKNNYCKRNNIRLIRIPYWERDNIEQILVKELNLTQQENIA